MSGHGSGRRWTPEEDEALRLHYPLHGPDWEAWKVILPGRTDKAISQRASVLSVPVHPDIRSLKASAANSKRANFWTKTEIRLLVDNFAKQGASWNGWNELLPNRTTSAIKTKARELGLIRVDGKKSFTNDERKRILEVMLGLAEAMNARPYDVAMEIVRLGKEHERQAKNAN